MADSVPTLGPTLVVNGPALLRTFHAPDDVDHVRFVPDQAGIYTATTAGLTGGTDTILTLLRADGQVILDGLTGRVAENDDDPTAGAEFRASRIVHEVGAAEVGQPLVLRVRNRLAYGAGVSYTIKVERTVFSGPTATRTATPTPRPTRRPAGVGDPYESDNARASAVAYDLKNPILHQSDSIVSGNRGPRHTFHVRGDADWVGVELGMLQPGSVLEARTIGSSRLPRTLLRTKPVLYLYRPDADAIDGFRLVAVGSGGCGEEERSTGESCLTWRFDGIDARLYSFETWYLRTSNQTPFLYGAEIGYGLSVQLFYPRGFAPPTATPTASPTATATVTATPGRTNPGGSPTVTPTVTRTATPTVPRKEFKLRPQTDQARHERFELDRGVAFMEFPPGVGFYRRSIDDPANKVKVASRGLLVGLEIVPNELLRQLKQEQQNGSVRAALQADGLEAVKAVSATAADEETGEEVTDFDLAIEVCVRFALGEVEGVDQSTLRPFYLDPLTGGASAEGLSLTRLTPASDGQDGELCFKTTHFTDFELAASPLAVTPTPVTYRIRLPYIFNRSEWAIPDRP